MTFAVYVYSTAAVIGNNGISKKHSSALETVFILLAKLIYFLV